MTLNAEQALIGALMINPAADNLLTRYAREREAAGTAVCEYGMNSEKLHKIAHKKRACQNCTKSRRTREKSSKKYNKKRSTKNATKCNAKKSIEPRAKLEESTILQHEHGRGMDAPGIYVHDTRAEDRGRPRAGDGNLLTR